MAPAEGPWERMGGSGLAQEALGVARGGALGNWQGLIIRTVAFAHREMGLNRTREK